ncbi:MAG: hypothetical protein LQ345_001228 [Seirophora villosa]|nr:MAG: hypothetical protein LQ345_001228 [Seirophora villosa]
MEGSTVADHKRRGHEQSHCDWMVRSKPSCQKWRRGDDNLVGTVWGRSQHLGDAWMEVIARGGLDNQVNEQQRLEVMRILLKQGAIDSKTDFGYTPLHMAVGTASSEIIATFPDYGFDIDARANDGSTPLFLAIIENRIAVAELLTRRGAAVDMAVNSGVTPLAVAIEHASDQLVEDLIAQGANVSEIDYYGMTCIDCPKRQRPHLLTLPSIALKLGDMVSCPDMAILRRNTSGTAAEVRIHRLEDNGPHLSRLSKGLLMLGMEDDARLAYYQGKLPTLQHSSRDVICDGCNTKQTRRHAVYTCKTCPDTD